MAGSLHAANDHLLRLMNQLDLPEVYRDQPGILHVEVAAQFGTGNLKSEPSVKKKYKWAGREHSERGYTLNDYGFRDRDWTIAPQQGRRVMFVGDSFVEGFGLGDDGTIPVRFAACAEAAREQLEVMSFGVGAADIPHYQALIHDAVPLFRPSSVILVIYANDLPGPPFDERWLESPLAARRSMLLLPRAVAVIGALAGGQTIARRWRGNHPTVILYTRQTLR